MVRMTTIRVTTTVTIILIALQASLSTATAARTLISHQLPSQNLCQIVCQLARQLLNHHTSQTPSQIPSQMSTVTAMIWWRSLLIFIVPTTVTLITIQTWIVIVMTMSMVVKMIQEVLLPFKAIRTTTTTIIIATAISTATMGLKEIIMKASITLLPMGRVV